MHLPSPDFTFMIPSVYDGTQLDCRIHLPRDLQHPQYASRWKKQGAMVAHPYAPLGGCYDDPVVSFVGGELLRSGYVVGTFNFRGAGESEGKTSWTAKPELADYVSVYGFMVHFLAGLDSEGPGEIHVILGGYSYGSLIASNLPDIDVIVKLFKDDPSENTLGAIRQTARRIAASTIEQKGTAIASMHASNPAESPSILPGTASYLLISPLVPPVSQFLTLFSKLSLNVGMQTSAWGRQVPCPKPVDQLCTHNTLVLYGNADTFTSASRLRDWTDGIAQAPGSRFESREIDGAGHFWRENGVETQARDVLRDWLSRTS